jgi:hypothetical protein
MTATIAQIRVSFLKIVLAPLFVDQSLALVRSFIIFSPVYPAEWRVSRTEFQQYLSRAS